MKENYFFKTIKKELKKKKERNLKIKSFTADENINSEQSSMELKDYWLSLRQSIQDKIDFKEQKLEEQDRERIKRLNELITPELMSEYKQILNAFNFKSKKNEKHPQREFIDINNEEFSIKIKNWIEKLIKEIENKRQVNLTDNDVEELRAQCWLLFDSIANVINANSLEKDIKDFYKDKEKEFDKKETKKQRLKLIKQLQERYPLDKTEIEILIDLIKSEKDKNYSLKLLIKTINYFWNEYKLGKKKSIVKISLGYLLARAFDSFAPSVFQNIVVQDKFKVAVFLEYFGLNGLARFIDSKMEIELAKLINEINCQINERIINSLFFQEFEFIHEKSLGEFFIALERGKNAVNKFLWDLISRFIPILSGIAMALLFLTKINPILGAIGVGNLPIMYNISKKKHNQISSIYEEARKESEKISTRLGSIKSGFENFKTSSEALIIASSVKDQMNVIDNIFLKKNIEQTKIRLQSMIPFEVSTIISAIVGGVLQEAGMISGGAILSNIIYSNYLNRPIQQLVGLYYDFSFYIQDIQRMYEILGQYEKLDLPEGEKEKDRLPVSEIKNFDISIKNLWYKNILRGINLEIKEGEFLTITGPSGIGKSTLLRNLVGLYKPDSGSIEIGGIRNDKIKKYGKESIYSIMSYCNQNPQIFEDMTLRENILLWSSQEEADDEKIKKILKDLHLEKFINKLDEKVKNLSGGERVRIGLARVLIKNPKIILLDEPTANLDSQVANEVRKIISEISEKYPDKTIICVTHDEELVKISKRSVNLAEL